MQHTQKSKLILALLALSMSLPTAPFFGFSSKKEDVASDQQVTDNKVKYAAGVALFALAFTVWKHLSTFPFDGKNRYNLAELKQTCKEIMCGNVTTKTLKKFFNQVWLFYADAIAGHPSKVGSPRFNDKTGAHEIPAIESRGVFGFISDSMDPFSKSFDFIGKTCAFYLVLYKGAQAWAAVPDQNLLSFDAMKKFADDYVSKDKK